MQLFFIIVLFLIGILFGSFFTLATHRLPLGQNITYERSYCPKCNHKLSFLDLIPVLSFLCLKGKCRYCKEKIKPTYLFLEILTGVLFVVYGISLKIDLYDMEFSKIASLFFGLIYISILVLIGVIDKRNKYIQKSVLFFGYLVIFCNIIYVYFLNVNLSNYIPYLIILLFLIIIDIYILKKKAESNYTIQILILCMYIIMNTKEEIFILTTILMLFLVAINQITFKPKNEIIIKKKDNKIPFGFYLGVSNIIILILNNFLLSK